MNNMNKGAIIEKHVIVTIREGDKNRLGPLRSSRVSLADIPGETCKI